MLTSLRPCSPPAFHVDSRTPPHYIPYPLEPAHRGVPAPPHQMEGSGAKRYTTPPPARSGAPYPHATSHYPADAGPHPLEQRPSPQSRQRSWHHPYMTMPRGSQGPSPPLPLEAGAMPLSRPSDLGPPDSFAPGVRHSKSPTYGSESLHAAPDSRSRASSRAEAQPLTISALPAYPSRDVERVGGIGPNRNRGRSSTLTLPHPDSTRVRGSSFIGARHHGLPHASFHAGYDEHSPLPPRSWEDGRNFRDAYASQSGDAYAAKHHSPKLRPSSRESPILFAPLSPSQDPHMQVPRRISGPMSAQHGNQAMMNRPVQYRSRPGTPISPLNMESLSMDEPSLPSASGMAMPSLHGQGRSPADARARNDYFGPAAVDRARQKHLGADMSGSPPSASYAPGLRNDPREHVYRAGTGMHGEIISPDTERARYHQASYPVGPPPMHSGRGLGHEAVHHPSMLRLEQIDRERFAAAQHVASSPDVYHGPGAPRDNGFHAEFTSQSRPRSASTFATNASQQGVPVDRIAHSRRRRRPPYSYSSMITQAIASSSEGRMTLREIYTWISTNFSGYPMTGADSQGWQNTVRHNLSLGKIFIKKARTAQDIYDSCSSGNPSQSQAARGKGGWWTLHPVVLSQIRSGQRTHNDEFDDVERLVETENASAKEGAGAAKLTTAAAMVATSSISSADGMPATRRASDDLSQHKTLSRQRSYSDSMDPTAVEHRRVSAGQHFSTAPVSRKTSIGASRSEALARHAYTPYAAPLADHGVTGSADRGRVDMPSVLQNKLESVHDDRVHAFGRFRGHSIGQLESSSPLRRPDWASKTEADAVGEQGFAPRRSPPIVRKSPAAAGPVGAPMVEDVEMEPSMASTVLQEARETLAHTKQQQLRRAQDERRSVDDGQDGAGRMAIRGLLNS